MWSLDQLTGFITEHGAALILPLAVVEGPIVSVLSGILAATGHVTWWMALLLLVLGDLIGDGVHYAIGRFSGGTMAGLSQRFGMRADRAEDLERRLHQESTKMLVIGKWTQTIGGFVLIGAGLLRIGFLRFLAICLLATIPKSAVLLGIGYFAGNELPFLRQHALLAGMALSVVGVLAIAFVIGKSRGLIGHRHKAES